MTLINPLRLADVIAKVAEGHLWQSVLLRRGGDAQNKGGVSGMYVRSVSDSAFLRCANRGGWEIRINWNLAVCLPMPSPSGRVAERKRGRERLLSFRRNIRNDLRFTALFRPSVRTGAPSPKGKAFPRQIPI